jgi:hypothetical protein
MIDVTCGTHDHRMHPVFKCCRARPCPPTIIVRPRASAKGLREHWQLRDKGLDMPTCILQATQVEQTRPILSNAPHHRTRRAREGCGQRIERPSRTLLRPASAGVNARPAEGNRSSRQRPRADLARASSTTFRAVRLQRSPSAALHRRLQPLRQRIDLSPPAEVAAVAASAAAAATSSGLG